jgi:hypothetical protein
MADEGTETGRAVANARGAVEAVRTASETVDEQLAAIDERADEQADEIAVVDREVSELSATIQEVAASAQQVAARSDEVAGRSVDGRAAAAEALDVVENVQETNEALATEVERLNDRIDTIETALAGIDDIAEQTNLLALNASIEAARAGDGNGSADGFAVVAEEIKALAAESQDQADTIDAALAEVQQAADETVAQLEATTEQIQAGADHIAAAMAEIDAVAAAVEDTASDVQDVSRATDELATSSETIAARSEDVAERATAIDRRIGQIRDARGEQTVMLREAETALSSVERDGASGEIPTDIALLDDHGGGLVAGGQSVVTYDGRVSVDDLVATMVASALDAGLAVSLTPTPTLDRATLAAAVDDRDGLSSTMDADRLFVLDAFDTWESGPAVFDLGTRSLGEVNRETDRRRDAPLLVVGNVAGECAVLGEREARAARYENDGDVFEPGDTVVNVVDETAIDDAFAAFYAGAADQVLRVEKRGNGRRLTLVRSPGVTSEPTARLGASRPSRVASEGD